MAGDKKFGGLAKSRGDTPQQRQIDSALSDLASVYLVNGVLIEDIELGATANVDFNVLHGLGREAKGFLLAKSTHALTLYVSPSVNPAPTLQTVLRANYTGGVSPLISIWFF